MNRREFLGSLLGIAAGAALPKPALAVLERAEALSDAQFTLAVYSDDAIIDLLDMRMREAMRALVEAIDISIYREFTK